MACVMEFSAKTDSSVVFDWWLSDLLELADQWVERNTAPRLLRQRNVDTKTFIDSVLG